MRDRFGIGLRWWSCYISNTLFNASFYIDEHIGMKKLSLSHKFNRIHLFQLRASARGLDNWSIYANVNERCFNYDSFSSYTLMMMMKWVYVLVGCRRALKSFSSNKFLSFLYISLSSRKKCFFIFLRSVDNFVLQKCLCN